jgi:hypothetical protein
MDSVFSLAEQCGADGAPAGIGGRVGLRTDVTQLERNRSRLRNIRDP